MKSARLLEPERISGSGAKQRLYELRDGDAVRHVVVSAVIALGEPETYIFDSDAKGEITDWCEREGSFRGDMDHEEALRRAGYEVSQ